jgi:hypothetical protein
MLIEKIRSAVQQGGVSSRNVKGVGPSRPPLTFDGESLAFTFQNLSMREMSGGGEDGPLIDERPSLVERIGLVFQRAGMPAAERPEPAEVEALLAEGYAEALLLEMEQARLERRIADLFAAGPKRSHGSPARELRMLGAKRFSRESDIVRLRSLLEELRDYGTTLKSP